MFKLRCTVRNCEKPLALLDGCLRCESGHSFDRAKQGYWSLLQPQDRRSLNAGDSDEAVMARHRWLARGYMTGMVESLRPWIVNFANQDGATKDGATKDGATTQTLELGCGDGGLAPALFVDEANGYCGIELSKKAIRLAARNWPETTWVMANADRVLPAENESVDRVVSLFGRRPVSEIARVLKPSGVCIVTVPGATDLIELREIVQKTGVRRSRWEAVAEELADAGIDLIERKIWKSTVELDPAAIHDAMTMTYRAGRNSEQSKLASLEAMSVTLAADALLFQKLD